MEVTMEDESMNHGIVEISDYFLLKLLELDGGELLSVQWDIIQGRLILSVLHPEFPKSRKMEYGELRTPINLRYTSHYCGHVCALGEHLVVTRDPI